VIECKDCGYVNKDNQIECKRCFSRKLGDATLRAQSEVDENIRKDVLSRAELVTVLTVHSPKTLEVAEELGMVFGNSSKQAFWGLSAQSDRLSRAYEDALMMLKYEAALLGANAIVGVTFALNNSTGSSATLLAGSSEAVMLLGTAVKMR
jgi:uncharacterized protein YbjQ (UPF0145 family)